MNLAPQADRVKAQCAPRAQKTHRDAIDAEPLTGRARNEFEATLHAKVKRSHQLVLRILLDFAGGKAECWPGNKRVAEIAGYEVRNVQLILRALEGDPEKPETQVVRCLVDRSLKTQRRIVILDHPNAVQVLLRMGQRPWLQSGAQKPAPKPTENVHPGAQESVHPGAQNSVSAGAQKSAPDFSLNPNSETRIPGFSRSLERPRPRPQAEQVAFLRARIAAAGGAP